MRTIIVGDVHGCREELESLLDRTAFTRGDRLVFVGDLVAKGPDSLGVLDIANRTGAVVVRGNHEQRLLDLRRSEGVAVAVGKVPSRSGAHRELALFLRPRDWELIETSPLFLELPEHDACIVHAGIAPGVPLDMQKRETLLQIRTVPTDAKRPADDPLWGEVYTGPPHVVFGHNAAPGLQLHAWATGLDTGCVYGGALTAMVLAERQPIHHDVEERRGCLISEPARRIWCAPTRGKA